MNTPEHSKPGAIPFDSPAHEGAMDAAKMALEQAVEEFERKTGRTVDSIHMSHIDVTNLQDEEPQFVRDFHLSFLWTEAEEVSSEALNEKWRLYLAGDGPRPTESV